MVMGLDSRACKMTLLPCGGNPCGGRERNPTPSVPPASKRCGQSPKDRLRPVGSVTDLLVPNCSPGLFLLLLIFDGIATSQFATHKPE